MIIHVVISSQEFKGTGIVNIHSLMVKNRIIENTSVSSLEYGNQHVKNQRVKSLEKNNFCLFEDSFHNCLKSFSILKDTLLEMWLPTAFFSLKTSEKVRSLFKSLIKHMQADTKFAFQKKALQSHNLSRLPLVFKNFKKKKVHKYLNASFQNGGKEVAKICSSKSKRR